MVAGRAIAIDEAVHALSAAMAISEFKNLTSFRCYRKAPGTAAVVDLGQLLARRSCRARDRLNL